MVVSMESGMNETLFTASKRLHLESEVFNPILSIWASSPRYHHSFGHRLISNISCCQSHFVVNVSHVDKFGEFLTKLAVPWFDAFFRAVWQNTIRYVHFRQLCIISSLAIFCSLYFETKSNSYYKHQSKKHLHDLKSLATCKLYYVGK